MGGEHEDGDLEVDSRADLDPVKCENTGVTCTRSGASSVRYEYARNRI